jgi:hypothetical protein
LNRFFCLLCRHRFAHTIKIYPLYSQSAATQMLKKTNIKLYSVLKISNPYRDIEGVLNLG